MTVVQFPSLGITLEVNPVAFTIGDFSVQWYGVIIAAGFLLAFLYAMVSCRKFNVNKDKLIEIVAANGGHLSSNLGVVELTVALHRVFNVPTDKIVWDVGHQAYTHKMLTGRRKQIGTIRKKGGLSGFPNRDESEYCLLYTSVFLLIFLSRFKMIR